MLGEWQKRVINVPVQGDLLIEDSETFQINIFNPSQGVVQERTAEGTILRDDPPRSLNLGDLNGNSGLQIVAPSAIAGGYFYSDITYRSQVGGGGDINGDGIDDIIVGIPNAFTNSPRSRQTGLVYVVFGQNNLSVDTIDIDELNGDNGFIIEGLRYSEFGYDVSNAGDVNGDGFDDLIVGSYYFDDLDTTYIIFGSNSGFPASFNISTLNGSNGFKFIDNNSDYYNEVSNAGDINGDGIGDLIISSSGNDGRTGFSYVIFGSNGGFSPELNSSSLDGGNGFVIEDTNSNETFINSVSSAGDVNGDGIDDLIIGKAFVDANGQNRSGASYVVFGTTSGFSASFDLSSLNGSNGFTIEGISSDDRSGSDVSNAGDFNGDGIDDLIIGAPTVDVNGETNAGNSYVIFGTTSEFSANFDLSSLNGNNGFTIEGISRSDRIGSRISNAGDFNGDGIDDLIIGAPTVDVNGETNNGTSYIIFGSANGFAPKLSLEDINGANGFIIEGTEESFSGGNVSNAGDVNNDGFDDVIIGSFDDGKAFIVYGFAPSEPIFGSPENDLLVGTPLNDIIRGREGNDTIVGQGDTDFLNGQAGNDSLLGSAGDDSVLGGSGNDILEGNLGEDSLFGNSGQDTLVGGIGNDFLFGGVDNDSLNGSLGGDRLNGGDGDDTVIGSAGQDTLFGSQGNDSLIRHLQ